eukprot:411909-Prorocentrum_minimum.AAC.3
MNVKTKVSPGLAKIGNVVGSIIEAVAENERGAEGGGPRLTGQRKDSGLEEDPLIWRSSSARSYLDCRAKSARGRPSTAHRLDAIQSSDEGSVVGTPGRSRAGTHPPSAPPGGRQGIRSPQSATGSPTTYQVYREGGWRGDTGRPGTGKAKQRASSARPAADKGMGGAEGQGRPGYSIKYFGVAHGQLGVLTRRKVRDTLRILKD